MPPHTRASTGAGSETSGKEPRPRQQEVRRVGRNRAQKDPQYVRNVNILLLNTNFSPI
jgi:hypothetical protein